MAAKNNVTEIILLGFSPNQDVQKTISVVFLLMYTAIVLGNGLIVATIMASKVLTSPMYFFLSYLSFVEICYCSVTAPKLILDSFIERKSISLKGCITQIFFLHFFGGTEIFLLTVMAYDRYVAICKPLHYTVIMNRRVCGLLVGAAWGGGLLHSVGQTFLIFQLPFCGLKVLDHYFCDVHPMLTLACSDTFLIGVLIILNGGSISVISFMVLLASYVVILCSLRTRTSEGRRKALSTCASHIAVVGLFFIPCSFVYMRPCVTLSADKIVAVFYTVLTPLLNPFIYSFRNAEVKNAMRRLMRRTVIWGEK
ncbi:olfactory receptor 4X1 [Ursus americanus]|uniref:Olfactory receptor n=1 Tax=Ursus maritimus TaxID=29073 RepID=A0A384CXG4_URSMA|nr:olfactory receptor 4X1 [Ursus maritimus]XP_026367640.1 olfactory receptor 4X1 [Ursus arctos]XP_045642806.1 olfactory receptor 4X1 [Ursus americanus]